MLTVTEELRRRGQFDLVGGQPYLSTLIDSVPTPAHCKFYARIVQEKSILRRLIDAAGQVMAWAYEEEEEVDDIVDKSERRIFEVAQRHLSQYFVPLRPLLFDALERLDVVQQSHERLTGMPTGFTELDEMTSGLQPSDFIVVAGRPSMGKTALCLNIAVNAAQARRLPIALFSLEMSKEQLVQRMICSEARVNGIRLRTGYLREGRDGRESDMVRITRAIGTLGELPIYIDDVSDITAMEMRAKCRRLRAEHNGLGLVVIDYLQLIRGHGRSENRNQEISLIARSLKGLARELNVPVIALSQLSRAVEKRDDKRPMLSDLRECVVGDTRLINATTGALVPIRNVKPGDVVLGLGDRQKIGAFAVRDVWSTGVKPVFKLTTRTGRVVTATANHPFLTATGWRRLEELRHDEALVAAAEACRQTRLDTIRKIEPAGEAKVYDIRVPGSGNLLANGVVVHNSGSIEAEADMVMMLYRSRYYNRGEDGTAEEGTPQQPAPGEEQVEESELIIAKHRNGPTGLVKLAFLRQYARFENLADY
jgi:replicative DNA helicase